MLLNAMEIIIANIKAPADSLKVREIIHTITFQQRPKINH